MKKDISIVTPFHNTEMSFFEKTVSSVVAQSLNKDSFEWVIIFHNCADNYIDDAKAIIDRDCKDLCTKLYYLKDDTKSPSEPRNVGIRNAEGKYLYFLDSDDLVDKDFLLKAIEIAETDLADIVFAKSVSVSLNENLVKLPVPLLFYGSDGKLVIDNERYKLTKDVSGAKKVIRKNREILGRFLYGAPNYLATKLIKRELLIDNNIFFDKKYRVIEDVLFNVLTIARAKKLVVLTDVQAYTYYQREGSQIQSLSEKGGFTKELYLEPLKEIAETCEKEDIDYNIFLWSMFEMFGTMVLKGTLSNEEKEALIIGMSPYKEKLKKIPYLGENGAKNAESMRLFANIFMRNNAYEHTNQAITVIDMIENTRNLSGKAVCMENGEISFEELHAKSDKVAVFLLEKGYKRGKRIGLCMRKSIDAYIALYGIIKTGATLVVISGSNSSERNDFIKKDANIDYFIDDECFNNVLTECEHIYSEYEPIKVKGTDDFVIIYTSGSEGKPKGVRLSNINVTNMNLLLKGNEKAIYQYSNCNTYLMAMDIDFLFGFLVSLEAMFFGKTLYVLKDVSDINSEFAKKVLLDDSNKINISCVPSASAFWFTDGNISKLLKNVSIVAFGGEGVKRELMDSAKNALKDAAIFQGYATTETGPACYEQYTGDVITAGVPQADVIVSIVDEDINPVPLGEKGRVCITGYRVSKGYLNIDSDDFLPARDNVNTFISKDEGFINEEGRLCITGRLDRMQKVHGVRIEPAEVENAFLEYSGVNEAAAKIIEKSGKNSIYMFYCSERQLNEYEIRSFLSKKIPYYMIPDGFIRINKMPLTNRGKLDYNSLNPAEYLENQVESTKNCGNETIISKCFKELLNIENVNVDSNFFALGGDSLLAIKLVVLLEQHNIKIKVKDIFAFPTPSLLMQFVDSNEASTDNSKDTFDYSIAEKKRIMEGLEKIAVNGTITANRGGHNEEIRLEDVRDAYAVHGTIKNYFDMQTEFREAFRYTIRIQFETTKKIDEEYITKRVRLLQKKHPVLNSYFTYIDGVKRPEFIQLILNKKSIPVFYEDLSDLNIDEGEKHRTSLWEKLDTLNEFFTVASLKISEDHYTVLVRINHVVADALSSNILLNELVSDEQLIDTCEDRFITCRNTMFNEKQDVEAIKSFFDDYLKDAKLSRVYKGSEILRSSREIVNRKIKISYEKYCELLDACKCRGIIFSNYVQYIFGKSLLKAMNERALIFLSMFAGRNKNNVNTVDNYFNMLPICIRDDMNIYKFQENLIKLSELYYLTIDELGAILRKPFHLLGCADGINSNLIDSVLERDGVYDAKQIVWSELRGNRAYIEDGSFVIEISNYTDELTDVIYNEIAGYMEEMICNVEEYLKELDNE